MRPPLKPLHLLSPTSSHRFVCGVLLRCPIDPPVEPSHHLAVYITCKRCLASIAYRSLMVEGAFVGCSICQGTGYTGDTKCTCEGGMRVS